MTTHPSKSAGASQNARILAALEEHRGIWVPMPLLAAESGAFAVHSRIADLRKEGLTIEQRNQRKGRSIHSSYRLP
jgi:biotin operon repressor